MARKPHSESAKQIELFINTLIKNKFSLEIEGFSLALQQQLPRRNHANTRHH
jgi:hypothetical protein